MQTVFEALTGPRGRRPGRQTGQRVHRYSRTEAGGEGRFWQPFNPRNVARFMQAAEKYDRLKRLAHRRERNNRENGAIGHVGLEVLRELLRLIDYKTGRLDPAIATLALRIGRSIAAVADALKRLKAHGFIDWLRRYVTTGNAGMRGPQVKQTSNAYRLMIPAQVEHGMTVPLPEDDSDRRKAAIEEGRAMIARLPLDEQPAQLVDDPGLAAILARLGWSIISQERDSDRQNESRQS
ncbi:MAG: replication protein A [Pseudomonadota bacterium]|nr:replication protein A [Pseudomonadota bacterium]